MTDFPARLGFKLLHIGIAVPSLEETTHSLAELLAYKLVSGPFDDPIQKVRVSFLAKTAGDVAEIELIAPLSEDSPVHSILKKGGGAYHLCYETNDLEAALLHARESGCVVIAEPVPAVAFQNRRIAWVYTPARLLLEFVEARATKQAGT